MEASGDGAIAGGHEREKWHLISHEAISVETLRLEKIRNNGLEKTEIGRNMRQLRW